MMPALRQAFLDAELRGLPLAALGWLASDVLDPVDYRRVKLDHLTHRLGCSKSSASDALTLLVERGYLQKREAIDGAEYRVRWTREVRYSEPLARSAPPSAA